MVEETAGLPHTTHTCRSGLNTEGKLKKMIILPDFWEDKNE